jgi:hypothetical protein
MAQVNLLDFSVARLKKKKITFHSYSKSLVMENPTTKDSKYECKTQVGLNSGTG